jgi:hypothetical protein
MNIGDGCLTLKIVVFIRNQATLLLNFMLQQLTYLKSAITCSQHHPRDNPILLKGTQVGSTSRLHAHTVRATPAIHYNRDDVLTLQEGARGVARDAHD